MVGGAGADEIRLVGRERDRAEHRRADRVQGRSVELSLIASFETVLMAATLCGVSVSCAPVGSPAPIGASSSYQPVPPSPVIFGT